ncbi:MAG: bifunctional metallophosphatase/5'-nucleotidase [Calditrichia bacterium]
MKTLLSILIATLIVTSGLFAEESADTQRLTIFFTNDIHGGIVPQRAEFLNPDFPPTLGGGPAVATILKGARAKAAQENAITLMIDGGDTYQGTLVGTESKGMAVVEYMNMIGYDASVPGNHEFDLGKDVFIEMVKASKFSWIAANIYNSETGERWEWVEPWTILEKGGMRIGITGVATTGTAAMSFAKNIEGLEFRNEILALEETVAELRKQNVDLVISIGHVALPFDPREGYEELKQQTYEKVTQSRFVNSMEIAHFVEGIDILLGGHLHKGYEQVWEDPKNHTICLQNYANGGNLGWIDFEIDRPTRSIAGYNYVADNNSLLLLQQEQFWPDSTMQAFVDKKIDQYEKDFRDVIGLTKGGLTRSSTGEGVMNNLVCDAMLASVEGSDFSFMNFGGIRAEIQAGPITKENVFRVMPFDNEITSFQANGAYIKMLLERKLNGSGRGMVTGGAKIVFNRNLPNGERVTSITVNGEELDAKKMYTLVTTDYLMGGNSGLTMLRAIPRARVNFTGKLLRNSIEEYIRANTPLDLQTDGRWKKDDGAKPTDEWKAKFEKK